MGTYSNVVLTTEGQNLISSAVVGSSLVITKVVASSNDIHANNNKEALTTLSDIKQQVEPNKVSIDDNTITVRARFSNTGLETGYNVYALGVYGKVGDGSEKLIALCATDDPDEMTAFSSSPMALIYNISFAVEDAENVTVTITNSGVATLEDIQDLQDTKLDKNGDGQNVTVTFDDSTDDPDITSFATFCNAIATGKSLSALLRSLKTGLSKYTCAKIHRSTTASTYGAGSDTHFGHVKLSDVYNSQIGTAAQSIGASQKAVADAYSTLNSNLTNYVIVSTTTESFALSGGYNDIHPTIPTVAGYNVVALISVYAGSGQDIALVGFKYGSNLSEVRYYSNVTISSVNIWFMWLLVKDIS